MRKAPAALLAVLCLSCAHTADVDLATLTSNSDQTIYEAGQKLLARREWDSARKHFKRIIDGFPQSTYGGPARLALADSHFKEGGTANYILAVSEYRDFLQLFPTKPESPYAQFQVGEAYYRQRNTPDRDQTPNTKALEEFQRLLANYPSSSYVEQARERVVACRQSLARAEFLAGFFYEHSRKAYRASIFRYQGVVSDFPDYDQLDAVLYHLAFSLTQSGRGNEALPILARLEENYPKSPLLVPAKALEERAKTKAPAPPASPAPPTTAAPPPPGVAPAIPGTPELSGSPAPPAPAQPSPSPVPLGPPEAPPATPPPPAPSPSPAGAH